MREHRDAAFRENRQVSELGKQCLEPRSAKERRPGYVSQCPLAGAPGASLVRRSFFAGPVMSPPNRDEPLRPLPISDARWKSIAQRLHLSPRQTHVVELVLRDMSDKEIMVSMRLKKSTLRTYFSRIFNSLNVANRHQIILHVFAEAERCR